MTTYVLVHGAWMGAWAWTDVSAGLRSVGAKVSVVELPAHGSDRTTLAGATLGAYVEAVARAVREAETPVVLVGHSMAGMVITQVAEDHPSAIAKLVYLAAYLPKNGQKLLDWAMTDGDSRLGQVAKFDEASGTADVPIEHLEEVFLADGSASAVANLKERYRVEPLAPFVAPVRTSEEAWGRVPKAYIYTKNDRAVSYALQQRMTAGVTLAASTTLDTSHSPFLSQPELVVASLASLGKV